MTKKTNQQKISALKRKADVLIQKVYKQKWPKSLISGQPTETIHHYVQKSQCERLRYDPINLIPLTNAEHCRHHTSGDPRIVEEIVMTKGLDWVKEIQKIRGQSGKRLNQGTLNQIIADLEEMVKEYGGGE